MRRVLSLASLVCLAVSIALAQDSNSQEKRQGLRAPVPQFFGVGVGLRKVGSEVIVRHVHPGSPADKAKIKQGDALLRANGKPLADTPLDGVVKEIRGAEGSPVLLELKDARSGKVRKITVKRAKLAFKVPKRGAGVEQLELSPVQGGCPDYKWSSCSCQSGCDETYCERECVRISSCLYNCHACQCGACA